ncbi:MAG: 4Fe-4S binding protein [Anaerolineales bacterium]|nr:4Fe-4S binding protein [Anaerolineales bacterium]
MSELAIELAGLKMKNPLIVASSELTNTVSKVKEAEKYGASAVSTKLCFLHVPFYARPYHIIERGSALFSPSGQRLTVGEAQDLIRKTKRETTLYVIANMMGPGDDLEGWGRLAQMLQDAGADMVELNMSCPNIGIMAKELRVEAPPEMGALLGQNPTLAGMVVKAVSDAVEIPVMPKMTPDANTTMVSAKCIAGGASAISAINCPQSLPSVDVFNGGRPLYPTTSTQAFAGLCGPWIRPLAYRHVAQMALTIPNIQIAGGGGLTNWRQSVEMIMYGATALTYCTILYLKGFEVLSKIEAGLRRFVVEQGYKNILDVRGMALQYVTVPHDVVYLDKLPKIDLEKCVGCGFCIRPGHCEALAQVDEKAALVEPDLCTRCGVCYWLCPHDAISMVPVEEMLTP